MATLIAVRPRGARGQAVIELALTLPLLLLVVLGIIDFGFMFQKYEIVTNAAREGARVGVLPGYSVTDAQNRALAYLAAGGIAPPKYQTVSCGGAAVVNNQRCAAATPGSSTLPGVGGGAEKTLEEVVVVVEVDHEFTFIGPLMNVFGSGLGTTRLRAVATMRAEPD